MIKVIFFLLLNLFLVASAIAANNLPRDSEGWTILAPSGDSRIAYVSSSEGNNSTARVSYPSDPSVGTNPFLPSGTIRPFRTISSAFKAVRDRHPDWILLKRGDSWTESLRVNSGRSPDEPFVVGTYGSACDRPTLKTGASDGFSLCCRSFHDIAITGIAFYAHTRDPNSPDYAPTNGKRGFNVYVSEGHAGTSLLIEDSSFRFYRNNVIQGPGAISDILIRRNLFLNNYALDGHSQGLYSKNASILLEENIFDNNGWIIRGTGGDGANGQATYFNHNTYFSDAYNTTFRENIFLRASSMGNKWRADSLGAAHDISIENNLYVEGEIGLSVGGNTENSHRFVNMEIKDNVLLDIGRSQPTRRTLGWYIDVQDWDGGVISGNLLLPVRNDAVMNVYGISVGSSSGRDIKVHDNIIYDLNTNRAAVVISGSGKSDIVFSANAVQLPNSASRLLAAKGSLDGYSFSSNIYATGRRASDWFLVAGQDQSLTQWKSLAPESSASGSEIAFPDPGRTLETYHASLGKDASMKAFVAELRQQSKCNWRREYTASTINDWFRAGFGNSRNSVLIDALADDPQETGMETGPSPQALDDTIDGATRVE